MLVVHVLQWTKEKVYNVVAPRTKLVKDIASEYSVGLQALMNVEYFEDKETHTVNSDLTCGSGTFTAHRVCGTFISNQ